jgi:hypothetical protein
LAFEPTAFLPVRFSGLARSATDFGHHIQTIGI